MKILVTGSDGFIGKNLSSYLTKAGHNVIAPSFAELDLTIGTAVRDFLLNHSVDVIVHCATTDRVDFAYSQDVLARNLKMFFNLNEYRTKDTRLINLGSGSEYNRSFWIPNMEEDYFGCHIPDDDHSYAKFIISKYIIDSNDDSLISLRIFGIYGPNEDYRSKFISNVIAKAICDIDVTIFKNVNYSYIYILDFCRVVCHLINMEWKYRDVNITGEKIDLLTIVKLVEKASGKSLNVKVLNEGFGVEYTGSSTRLREMLSDFVCSTHEHAISELYLHYLKIRDTLDVNSLIKDDYLSYARSIQEKQ